MVARLKLKGIDGKAHQEWSLRLKKFRPSISEKLMLVTVAIIYNASVATPSNCRKYLLSGRYRPSTVRSG